MQPESSAQRFSYAQRRRVLLKRRRQEKISARELARLAEVSYFSLSRFENGSRDLSPDAVERLEEALVSIIAGRHATQVMHAHRGETTAPLSEMMPAPRSRPGKRKKADELADLREENAILRGMVEVLKGRDARFEEAYALMREVVSQFEAQDFERPREANALLKRAARVLAAAKK